MLEQFVMGVIFSVCVSVGIFYVQNHIDQQRSESDEVLANVQFIRETVRDSPDGRKPFRSLDLHGADLSGLDLGCDVDFANSRGTWVPKKAASCADFTGADLSGARLDGSDLSGAIFDGATMDGVEATGVTAVGMRLDPKTVDGTHISGLFAGSLIVVRGTLHIRDSNLDGVSILKRNGAADPRVEVLNSSLTRAEVPGTPDGLVNCTETLSGLSSHGHVERPSRVASTNGVLGCYWRSGSTDTAGVDSMICNDFFAQGSMHGRRIRAIIPRSRCSPHMNVDDSPWQLPSPGASSPHYSVQAVGRFYDQILRPGFRVWLPVPAGTEQVW